jgi:CelD/BcsL family acetyltransferase involved in cellulose biosynthesis
VPTLARNLSRRLLDGWHHLFYAPAGPVAEPIESAGLRAACYSGWPAAEGAQSAWDALASAVPGSTAFHRPAWQRAAIDALVRRGRLRLIIVWEGASAAGVFPFQAGDDGGLETIAPHVTDFLDPLIDPACAEEVWLLALRLVASMNASGVTFHNVREAALSRPSLAAAAAATGFDVAERPGDACPYLRLPATWDEFLATRDAHARKEIRRKLNKAMKQGAARFERCGTDAGEIAASVKTALGLMGRAAGGKGADVRRTLAPVLEMAAPPLLASGQMWLTTLYLNDRPAACTLQFPHVDGPQLYNCGFDRACKSFSPGCVLLAELIRGAIESGAPTFDLLRGQEGYKYDLGAVDRLLMTVQLRRRR